MKVVLAPHLTVLPTLYGGTLGETELERYVAVKVADNLPGLLRDIIASIVDEHSELVVNAAPEVDAPPYGRDLWWLAFVSQAADDPRASDGSRELTVSSLPPSAFYGIDADGRLRLAHRDEIAWSAFVRAVREGHYQTLDGVLVVTRAGEFGGNGALVTSLVDWLLQYGPGVLLGTGLSRGLLRRDKRKVERLEALADDWAARSLTKPRTLREFVDTKDRWYPSVLAQRLGVSEQVARALLTSLGYVAGEMDVMQRDTSDEQAVAARARWMKVEGEPNTVTLDELLDGPEVEDEDSNPSSTS